MGMTVEEEISKRAKEVRFFWQRPRKFNKDYNWGTKVVRLDVVLGVLAKAEAERNQEPFLRKGFTEKLQAIIEDMHHIPSRRLPLGKNSWLLEWNEVIEQLEALLGAEHETPKTET